MEQIKIKVLKARTPEEIAKLTEEESNKLNGFATTIIFANSEFISFVYYSPKLENEKEPDQTKPTEKQIKTLKSLQKQGKIDKKIDPYNLTRIEVSKILEEHLPKKR